MSYFGVLPYTAKIIFTTCYTLMTIFGGCGNILSIICIYKKNHSSLMEADQIDQILISLAICDTLVSLTIYPGQAWSNNWAQIPYDHIYYKIQGWWTLSMTSVSSVTIIMLAAVKYLKLSRFAKFDEIVTTKRLQCMIVLTWFVPILAMSPYLISQSYPINICSFVVTCSTLATLPIFYALILHFYRRSREDVIEMASTASTRQAMESVTDEYSRKLIICSLWLIGTYFLCTVLTIPGLILSSLGIKNVIFYKSRDLIFLGNSCMNPVIYFLKDTKIRNIAKGLFKP